MSDSQSTRSLGLRLPLQSPKSMSRCTSPQFQGFGGGALTHFLTFDSTSPRSLLKVSPRIDSHHARVRSTPQNVLSNFLPASPSAANLSKGLKLLYNLYPQRETEEAGLDQPTPRESKLEQSILAPVRSYLRRRSSVRHGENADVMTRIRMLFSPTSEQTAPTKAISDIEKLSMETGKRRRACERRTASSSIACSPTLTAEGGSSPTPPLQEDPQPQASVNVISHHKAPGTQVRVSRPQVLVVNLPALPFSQHKSYNDEKDFVRRHLFEVAVESPSTEELERVLHRSKLSRKSLQFARKSNRLR